MSAPSKRDVTVVGAAEVDLVGAGATSRDEIGRSHHGDDRQAIAYTLASHLEVGTRSGLCWKFPSISAKSSDQAFSWSRSEDGTPSSSAVTIAGRGYARSAITSMVARDATASSRPSTISAIWSRRSSTRRGVNAF